MGRISRVEIAVGDAGDRLDDRNMGDRVDEDGEKRDGQWQAFGEGIILSDGGQRPI